MCYVSLPIVCYRLSFKTKTYLTLSFISLDIAILLLQKYLYFPLFVSFVIFKDILQYFYPLVHCFPKCSSFNADPNTNTIHCYCLHFCLLLIDGLFPSGLAMPWAVTNLQYIKYPNMTNHSFFYILGSIPLRKLTLGDLTSGRSFDNGCICFDAYKVEINDLRGRTTYCEYILKHFKV